MWDKPFLTRLFKLSLPIVLQNLFGVLGTSITTLMIGQLGDLAIAANGLAYQLFFLVSLAQFGVSSGCALFTAQFWGSRDKDSILKATGVSLLLGLGVGGFFAAIGWFFPHEFLGVFTRDAEVIAMGARFLRIVAFGYLFTPAINAYALILRTTGNARLPMLVSVSGVIINAILGYGLIFGRLGMPVMGLDGAAVSNMVARVAECLLLIWMVYQLKTPLAASPRQLFSFDRNFLQRILRKAVPVMFNELAWALGITAYSAIYARIGTEAIAAVSIKDTMENLLFVPFIGIVNACAILVGNAIGSGKEGKAYGYVRQTFMIIFGMSALLGGALFFSRDWIVDLYKISAETRFFGFNLLTVLSFSLWMRTGNLLFFLGMMRSGGDTRFAYIMDAGSMWLVGVPLALVGAFVLHLPVYFVYLLVMMDEALKFFVSVWRFRSRRWIHNLIHA